ncbi:MAG TPA: LLM class flavin-dependent oxidoreductase [Methylomirabilota bacterium]|jgi:5,10-methylenetetrahydromethanopterin reductase|nr:LLM class flavin-dependent oxidoreductase [Methylomirabilota bacterium]
MDIALRCSGGSTPAQCVELAVAAERAGFSSVWFAENPYGRGAWPAAAACAVATRRVRIGLGVFNPYQRHPTLMAMELAAFDELCEGRAVLGIGAGIPSRIRKIAPADRPLAAVRDAVTITRRLLRGETVTYTGKVFSADGVRLLEVTPRRPDLPILTAAMSEHALRLCGEIADGVMISNLAPPAFTRHAVRIVGDGAARAGRPAPREVIQYVPCAIGEDGDEARRAARQTVTAMLTAYAATASAATRAAMIDYSGLTPEEFADMIARVGRGEPLPDRLLAQYAIAGTADECRAQAKAYADAGVTELAIWPVGERGTEDIAMVGRALV